MLGRAYSATLFGIDAVKIEIEAQISSALKRFTMVGLPDGVLKEAKDRVRCAVENSGFSFPSGDVVINLAPAALPKSGACFDLAIALSVLAAGGIVNPIALQSFLILGELALDGTVKSARGVLAAACLTRDAEQLQLLVSDQSLPEAAIVRGAAAKGVRSLLQAVAFINGEIDLPGAESITQVSRSDERCANFGDVAGQHAAKRAMEIVAAGGHNLLMVGPPGSGKSMLAERVRSILPALGAEEQIEVSKIYAAHSSSGHAALKSSAPPGLIVHAPYRSPHHSTSTAGLIGGGSNPLPGEISLAHRGILFLDEVTEVRREALEALRQPLESKQVVISRAKVRLRFPCDFTLIAAMNPCPCGKRGLADARCICPPWLVTRYTSKLSGPIADRLDLQIWVPPVPLSQLQAELPADPTPEMRERVSGAQDIQRKRLDGAFTKNSRLSPKEVREHCKLNSSGKKVFEQSCEKYRLSARGYSRTLRVARTIADLEGAANIELPHITEALSYRLLHADN